MKEYESRNYQGETLNSGDYADDNRHDQDHKLYCYITHSSDLSLKVANFLSRILNRTLSILSYFKSATKVLLPSTTKILLKNRKFNHMDLSIAPYEPCPRTSCGSYRLQPVLGFFMGFLFAVLNNYAAIPHAMRVSSYVFESVSLRRLIAKNLLWLGWCEHRHPVFLREDGQAFQMPFPGIAEWPCCT